MNLDIADGLWQAVQQGHLGIELEFRLGRMVAGHFCPNVGKAQFEKLKARLDESKSFEKFTVDTVERISERLKHVTTLSLTQGGASLPPPPEFYMHKAKLFQKDMPAPGSPYCIRCSIARETIVGPQETARYTLTRRKKRWRYKYRYWVFDLTEVVSNADVDEEESYEVEIELLDTGLMFERTMDAVAEWGLKLSGDAVAMLHSKKM